MMPDAMLILLAVVLALAAYTLQKRLMKIAQPERLAMAALGEKILTSANASQAMRDQVSLLLGTAFTMRRLIVLGYFMTPVLAVFIAFNRKAAERIIAPLESPFDAQLATDFRQVSELHDRISRANHPVLMFVLSVEIIFCATVASVLAAPFRRTLPSSPNSDLVMTAVYYRSVFFRPQSRPLAPC